MAMLKNQRVTIKSNGLFNILDLQLTPVGHRKIGTTLHFVSILYCLPVSGAISQPVHDATIDCMAKDQTIMG